ncbi:phosphoribosylglycinamide formyltransferase [Pasteurellaceae bacterium HPA106]|uniref:phosphoribosylglycinamide formyltransferase n=1 Tax=Spirabiliibacterium pneumoniae TaxID=221400 RepID=UPI001AAD80F5|nr:phosphoribosylglycinamide formyltransferase [Spirabiliibacterium pneumoniae]MBE2895872.1 phosphoribosylglycinamide formyltransferase [Spirabiliibacterium pneumoniae]
MRLAVLLSGNGQTLQAIIEAQKCGHLHAEIACVISDRSDAYGLVRAQQANIATAVIARAQFDNKVDFEQALIDTLTSAGVELVVLAGFMRVLSPHFISHFAGRILNIHPSLLPKFKGLNTHQRAIDAGEQEHGTSVHFVDESLDGGAVILQAKVPIFPEDSLADVEQRVKQQEQHIYPLVISWFAQGRLVFSPPYAVLDGNVLGASGYASD